MTDEKNEPIPINIGNICGGALVEAFEVQLAKILTNIADPNTEARAKRHILFDVVFAPKDDRTEINIEFDSRVKLASLVPVNSKIWMGKDVEGTLYALDEDPRQMNIFTPPKPAQIPQPIPFASGTK